MEKNGGVVLPVLRVLGSCQQKLQLDSLGDTSGTGATSSSLPEGAQPLVRLSHEQGKEGSAEMCEEEFGVKDEKL